jgi:hypothetical protein
VTDLYGRPSELCRRSQICGLSRNRNVPLVPLARAVESVERPRKETDEKSENLELRAGRIEVEALSSSAVNLGAL